MTRPVLNLEVGFGSGVQTPSASIVWTDVTSWAMSAGSSRGRSYELDGAQAGTASALLDNLDGRFTPPGAAGGPYAGEVLLNTPVRLRATYGGSSYPQWQGFVERWPQQWDASKTWTQSPMQASDVLASLAQINLADVYGEELALDAPLLRWPCQDAAGSTFATQILGSQASPAVRRWGTNGVGAPLFASRVLGQLPGAGFDSTTGLGTTTGVYMSSAGAGYDYGAGLIATYTPPVDSTQASRYAWELWFSAATTPVGSPWVLLSSDFGSDPVPLLTMNTDGTLTGSGDAGGTVSTETSLCDGLLHHVMWGGAGAETLYVDGQSVGSAAAFTAAGQSTAVCWGALWTGGATVTNAFTGVLAQLAVYAGPLSSDRVAAHYAAGSAARSGESAGDRASAILSYAGWPVPASIGATSAQMGPADLVGKTVLGALQDVETAEGGYLGVTADGMVELLGRQARYNPTPAWTVGGQHGESPPTVIAYDYDPTYLYNQVTVSRPGGISYTATDAVSVAQYGLRTLQVTIDVDSDAQVVSRAQDLLNRRAQPILRISQLDIDPSSNPDLWLFALQVDVGDVLAVNTRSASGQLIAGTFIVESVALTADPSTGAWSLTMNASPADTEEYWVLGDPTRGVLGSMTRLAA